MSKITSIDNFGDARRFILETMIQLRDGNISVSTGMAIAASMKVLNDNIQCEINAAKLSILAQKEGHNFGAVARMGRLVIDSDQDSKSDE
ncbi:MAG: hypothetical protein Q8Q50_02765 [Methylobacter sp.]|nr:hypothetical protein [Methylobacter sp.]